MVYPPLLTHIREFVEEEEGEAFSPTSIYSYVRKDGYIEVTAKYQLMDGTSKSVDFCFSPVNIRLSNEPAPPK